MYNDLATSTQIFYKYLHGDTVERSSKRRYIDFSLLKNSFFLTAYRAVFRTVCRPSENIENAHQLGSCEPTLTRVSHWLFESRLNDLDERALQLIRQNGYFTLVSRHELRRTHRAPFPRLKHPTNTCPTPLPWRSTETNTRTLRSTTKMCSHNSFNLRHLESQSNFLSTCFIFMQILKYFHSNSYLFYELLFIPPISTPYCPTLSCTSKCFHKTNLDKFDWLLI